VIVCELAKAAEGAKKKSSAATETAVAKTRRISILIPSLKKLLR
jgi:hypothetical protein